jgi:hypothetical protein
MRDTEKEGERLEEAGLAQGESEAPAAGPGSDGSLAATECEPITAPAKHYRKAARAFAEAQRTEKAVEALMRLGADSAATAARFEARVDSVIGKPNMPWRKKQAAACPQCRG